MIFSRNNRETCEMKAYVRVIRHFFETTTLHGFKYLFSKYYCDRLGWLVCCCASACCAAVLCTVVWARFMQVPALLTLRELDENLNEVEMPLVAVCPPIATVTEMFIKKFNVNVTIARSLPLIFRGILRRKPVPDDQLAIVDEILNRYGLTFTKAIFKILPDCEEIVIKCQWQNRMIPCVSLFRKILTHWGVCCVAHSENFKISTTSVTRTEITRRLSLAVQCYDKPMLPNCKFYTKYDVEEWFQPVPLASGHIYEAHLTFVSVQDCQDPNNLLDGTCASQQLYSRSRCLMLCMESRCGCLDIMRLNLKTEIQTLRTCPLSKLNCLRALKRDNNTCNCLPTCKKVATSLALETSHLTALSETVDNLYSGLNVTLVSVLNLQLSIRGSRMFMVRPTETWITLLSSLGGVFNMFLGVGFFSALELVFLIIFRLPIALRKSTY